MEFKDYYAILGVDESADAEAIKRAYRKLARTYHPDVSKEPDADTKFKDVGEAYEVLNDPEKRKRYDRLRKGGWQPGQEFTPPPDWDPGIRVDFGGGGFTGTDASQFSDFFETIFGGGFREPYGGGRSYRTSFRARGEDVHYRLRIPLEDAYNGATHNLQMEVPETDARGATTLTRRTLKARIPAGVSDGSKIRLRGQGAPGIGGAPDGDLYLEIELEPHPLYSVEGRDLTLVLPVAPWEAALGASVRVPTPGGAVKLTVPVGSQAGQKLRLKGRGLPGEPPGDLYVVLQIVTPPADTEAARALYEEMARALPFNPREKLGV